MGDSKPKPLDARAITRIASDLQKASTDPATSASTYSALLSQLRTGVAATEEVLRSTRIGIIVNRLKDDKVVKDPGVRKEAIDLVIKWKNEVNKQKQRGGASPRPSSAATPAKNGDVKKEPTATAVKSEASPTATDSMKGVETSSEKWKTLKPADRTADKDGTNWHVTANPTRDSCLKLMYDGLVKDSTAPPSTILPLARAIESEVYALHAPESSPAYKGKIRSLFSNLKANAHLRESLLSDPPALTPQRLASMSPDELKSKEQAARDQALKAQNENNAKVGQEQKAISNFLQCGQCKLYKVAYSQAQTRSADEPMTTFCECTNCGKKWKFS